MRKSEEYGQLIVLFKQLKKDYPTCNLGRHISMALASYGDVWGTSDKELLHAFRKYQTELEYDAVELADPGYVDKVYNDALDLDHVLDEEEDEYE